MGCLLAEDCIPFSLIQFSSGTIYMPAELNLCIGAGEKRNQLENPGSDDPFGQADLTP